MKKTACFIIHACPQIEDEMLSCGHYEPDDDSEIGSPCMHRFFGECKKEDAWPENQKEPEDVNAD